MIEEASAEEDELLGMGDNDEGKEGGEGCALERDESLIKVVSYFLKMLFSHLDNVFQKVILIFVSNNRLVVFPDLVILTDFRRLSQLLGSFTL